MTSHSLWSLLKLITKKEFYFIIMRTLASSLAMIICSAALWLPGRADAQAEHRIRAIGIGHTMQQIPEFSVSGPRTTTFVPQQWLQIEVELDIQTTSPTGYVDRLEVEYFVAVTDATTKRTVLLTDRLVYLEANANERRVFVSAYVSPASLARVTGSRRPRVSDISAVAAVVTGSGVREPAEASTGGPRDWWKAEGLARQQGLVLPRSRTPFAPLWWDRYPRDAEGDEVGAPPGPAFPPAAAE